MSSRSPLLATVLMMLALWDATATATARATAGRPPPFQRTPAASGLALPLSRCSSTASSSSPLPFSFYEPPVFFSLAPKCGPENGGGIVSVGGIGLGSGDARLLLGDTRLGDHAHGRRRRRCCASPTLAVDDGSAAQSMLVALGQQFESAGEYHVLDASRQRGEAGERPPQQRA